MSSYDERFAALKSYLHVTTPSPSYIYNIMTSLEISQRIAMELCYNMSRSKFRSHLKPDLEDPDFEDPYIKLMPDNLWRYFKLNCCVYADRYKEPAPYTKYSAKKMYKPLSHIHLDFIRYLNNWYNSLVFLTADKTHTQISTTGFFIDKGKLDPSNPEDKDLNFLLEKADELAGLYGFSCAEDLFDANLLSPKDSKINVYIKKAC